MVPINRTEACIKRQNYRFRYCLRSGSRNKPGFKACALYELS